MSIRDHKVIQFLSKPHLLHYIMPLLIIYLIVGTVAQKYIGLYEATQIYFSNPVIWLGPLPLPGYPILIALIFISLCANLIFRSKWSLASAGIIITHIGAMLLILGGLFTALFSTEGYLDLREGETKARYHDYHAREFVLLDENNITIKSLPFKELQQGQTLRFLNGDAIIQIHNLCRNCEIHERTNYLDNKTYHGMAAHMALSSQKLEMNNEENMAGLLFELTTSDGILAQPTRNMPLLKEDLGSIEDSVLWDKEKNALSHVPLPLTPPKSKRQSSPDDAVETPEHIEHIEHIEQKSPDGLHVVLEDIPQLPEFSVGDQTYRIALRKVQRELPFTIQLIDFEKDTYIGTEMAEGYQSLIRIQDGDMLWESLIRMNEPLRYKGYSFYQSSFLRGADGTEISVLAVVWNAGRSFPYISSIAMCFGLLLHLFLRRRYAREGGLNAES